MIGGLNLMRFSEFLTYVGKAGFDIIFLSINPQLRSIPPIYWISEVFRRIPVVGDYFVISVYAMLKPCQSSEKTIGNFKVYNNKANSITPGAATLNAQGVR
jgi:hypothetical protein